MIVAHEDVLTRMSAPTGKVADAGRRMAHLGVPLAQQDLTFNGQAIQMFRLPAAHRRRRGGVVPPLRRRRQATSSTPRGIR